MRGSTVALLFLAVVAAPGCDDREAIRSAGASTADAAAMLRREDLARARQVSIVRSRPGYIVDSILPVDEEIRRFQATIAERPTGLAGGATSRAALVAALVRALERSDTTALAHLVVNRAEFGYLIYPTSPNAAPPYRQSPDLVWLSRSASTDKAMTRLLARFGGRPLGYAGFTCADTVDRQGRNTLWAGCVVRRVGPSGDTASLRLFGPIVRRDGRVKFLSLTNGL